MSLPDLSPKQIIDLNFNAPVAQNNHLLEPSPKGESLTSKENSDLTFAERAEAYRLALEAVNGLSPEQQKLIRNILKPKVDELYKEIQATKATEWTEQHNQSALAPFPPLMNVPNLAQEVTVPNAEDQIQTTSETKSEVETKKAPRILSVKRSADGKSLKLTSQPVLSDDEVTLIDGIPDFLVSHEFEGHLYGTNVEAINNVSKVSIKGAWSENHISFAPNPRLLPEGKPDHAFGVGFVRGYFRNQRKYMEFHSITDSFYSTYKHTRRPHFNGLCEELTDEAIKQMYLDGYSVFSSMLHYTPPFLRDSVTNGGKSDETILHNRDKKVVPINLLGLDNPNVPDKRKKANRVEVPLNFLDYIKSTYTPEQQQKLLEYFAKLYVRLKSRQKLSIDPAIIHAQNTNFDIFEPVVIDKKNPAVEGQNFEPIEMTLIVDALNCLLLKNGDRQLPITFSIGAIFANPVDLLFVSNPEEYHRFVKYGGIQNKKDQRPPFDNLIEGFDNVDMNQEKQKIVTELGNL